ncbi:hypothetical protein FQR65_LT08011 [Abscondita terminalis]|nr:hypothetical protein FQR65_LT08011 [Abscondita terminalis]
MHDFQRKCHAERPGRLSLDYKTIIDSAQKCRSLLFFFRLLLGNNCFTDTINVCIVFGTSIKETKPVQHNLTVLVRSLRNDLQLSVFTFTT